MDESQKHYVEQKEPNMRYHVLYDLIHTVSPQNRNM